MSRHLFDATLGSDPIRITVGYDRPTNQFFLIIGWVDANSNDVFAYASDLKLAYDPNDWRSIRRFLEKIGVMVPNSLWIEVASDAATRTGCRVVRHLADGTMRELMSA